MGSTMRAEAPGQTPLRSIPVAAWWVLLLMTVDYALGLIDRNTVAVLKTTLKGEFGIGDTEYGLLVTAFMVPYAVFYIICGRVVDRWGSRGPFTFFVVTWSLATIAAGFARSFEMLVATRVVLGAAEAGLLPVTIFALVKWFPRDRLATVYAIKNPLQTMGAILSPPLIAALAITFHWRAAFWVPGGIGLAFAALWWFADRRPPDYGDDDIAPPAQKGAKSGLTVVLANRALWGLIAIRVVSDPVWFFFQYWQAGYLQEELGLSLADVGRLLWIPPLLSVVLTFGIAYLSDATIARGIAPALSRMRVMAMTVILAPAIAVLPLTSSIPLVILIFATTYFMAFTWLAMSNILIADLFPKNQIGSALGIMSFAGTISAAAFNAAVGPALEVVGYAPIFYGLALLHPFALLVLWRSYRGKFAVREAPAPLSVKAAETG